MEEKEVATYGLIALGFVVILLLRWVGAKISAYLRKRRAHHTQARRHFVKAASLVSQARSGKLTAGEARTLAGTAINEADLALELDPKDAAPLIVKSLALEVLKKPAAAVKALDLALSSDFSKGLASGERADTLAKRAELILGQMKEGNRDGRVQGVLADLQESISLKPSNARVHHMLGECCEKIGDTEDAMVAYRQALVMNPSFPEAKAALERLEKGSSSPSSVAATV